MATYRYIAGAEDPMSELRAVLVNSGYFDTVSLSEPEGETWTLNCISGSNTVLTWTYASAASYPNYNVSVSLGGNTFTTSFTSSSNKEYMKPCSSYQCTGGLLIKTGTSETALPNTVIITTNQNGALAIIIGTGTTYTTSGTPTFLTSTYTALCSTDTGSYKTRPGVPINQNETLLVPIPTCGGFGQLTYTDATRFVSDRQHNITGYISYNSKRYFTDGVFAVEDIASN